MYPNYSTKDAEKGENDSPMPLEKELKFLEINREDVLERLDEQKSRLIFDGSIRAVYFRDPSKDDQVTNRLRKKEEEGKDPVVEWTIKEEKSRNGARTCKEIEVIVAGFKRTRNMLRMNGLQEIRNVRKTRLSYELFLDEEEKAQIDIDDMTSPDIPVYLEIEAARVGTIRRAAAVLGLRFKDGEPWSTKDLLQYYGVL